LVDFFADSGILFSVREIKNNMKNTMTMTEIRRHFNLRNRREAMKAEALKKRRKEMLEAAEAVGNVVDGEIWDFGCEC
jgi:hypothetical protein